MSPTRMPVVFSAHGNPMNAVRDNAFTRFLGKWGGLLPSPKAILAISAHWETGELALTGSARPETMHDFYGFPDRLYALRYPAPGEPSLAGRAADLLTRAGLKASVDPARGLDHGAWSPLLRIYPRSTIPVVQLSLLTGGPPARHLDAGRALAPLRDEGVLIFGSGNLVHNLRTADLDRVDLPPARWAVEFDEWVESRLDAWDLAGLASFKDAAPQGRLAHPTAEHYLPILVAAGAAGGPPQLRRRPRVSYPFEGFEHGTIGMRCVELS